MVEITQEEFERLKGFEEQYNSLQAKYEEEVAKHNETKNQLGTLKDDYIAICKGQHKGSEQSTDDFDSICNEKFGK